MDNGIARGAGTRIRTGLLAAALVLGLAQASPSHAQMATTEAGPSLLAHIMNQINTLTQRFQDYYQYAEDALRWQQTWQHYYQQVARFMNKVQNPALTTKVPFEKVALTYGVEEICGTGTSGGGFSLVGLARRVIPTGEGNIAQKQQEICAQIQMLENTKHNAMVEYVGKIAPSLERDLGEITKKRAENNEEGTIAAIQEATTRLEAQQNQSEADLENQLKGCDMMIASLTRMQKVVAQQALKGKANPIVGTLVKTATLQAALKVGN